MSLDVIKEQRCFGGVHKSYRHASKSTACTMRFSVFVPGNAAGGSAQSDGAAGSRFPVLYYLSGLTCTDENFSTKAGAQRYAAEHGIVLVIPDTSPRGVNLPGEDDSYDFGSGAGFYVDATVEPWRRHYRMYTYVTEELPRLVAEHFPVDPKRQGVFGHSMGGHGALVVALRNPQQFKSVSAFSPVSSPMRCPWGQKSLSGYLGNDESAWRDYDATELVRARGYDRPILVDQGTADEFLVEQLKPELLEVACRDAHVPLTLNRREGYDHSYYFIATFVGEHIAWHASALGVGFQIPIRGTRKSMPPKTPKA